MRAVSTRGLAWVLACGVLLRPGFGGQVVPRAGAGEPPERLAAEGFDHFYSLEYDEAIRIFERLRDSDPGNPYSHHRVALAYLYKQFKQAGVLEGDLFGASNRFFRTKKIKVDAQLVGKFLEENQTTIRLCEQRLKQDKRDEEALYACGVAYATRATYQGLVERALLDSMLNASKANDYHTRLVQLDFRFYDAYLVPGLFDFAIGSLPGPVKVLLFFVGFSGEKQRGIRLVESVAQWGNGARRDAQILLTIMYRREKRFADARRTLEGLASSFPRNYVFPLEIASIYRTAGETDNSIRQYEAVLEEIRQGTDGFEDAPVARIHYELGDLYRKKGDLESARKHLAQVADSRGSTPELNQQTTVIQQEIAQALGPANPAPPAASSTSSASQP